MSGPGSYTKGMPSRGQEGGAMNDSLAQQSAQTPSPSTGSRQETHSVGSATSSASLAACDHAPRHAASALYKCDERERDEVSASMAEQANAGPGESQVNAQAARRHQSGLAQVVIRG